MSHTDCSDVSITGFSYLSKGKTVPNSSETKIFGISSDEETKSTFEVY